MEENATNAQVLAAIAALNRRLDGQGTQQTQPTQATTAKPKEEKVTDADISEWAARGNQQPVKAAQPTTKNLDADIERWAAKNKGKTETNYIF